MTEVFDNAGKEVGLQIWRVENLRLIENEEATRGSFYVGDSYVLLITKMMKNRMTFQIHFWLGNDSSQDERGAAAILSVHLNQELNDEGVIYRQVQAHESPEFMGLFKNGVKYMKGGVDSGFKHTETNLSESKRLLHVKGRRAVRATEVPLKWSSFNHGDSFILDWENTVYQWNGKDCNPYEKLKANNVARAIINDEKGGKGKLIQIEDGERIPKTMMPVLEGTPSDILPSIPDDVMPTDNKSPAVLYHVCADTGKLIITLVGCAPFDQEQLDSGDSYILDNGSHGKIFIWKGKGASKQERLGALENATRFIEEKNYNPATGIEVMAQGAETILFKQFFKSWRNKDDTIGFGEKYAANKIAKVEQIKFDMMSLGNSKLAAKHRMIDDGSGKLEIWRVEDDMIPVESSMRGIFFSGNCYIMLYTYSSRKQILYFWLGQQATLQQITNTTYLVVKLARKNGDRPVQARVVQGKEPPHLLSLFGGKPMIIASGKSRPIIRGNVLMQIYCTATGGRAVQVPTSARSLNSNDSFVLKTRSTCHVWVGIGASDVEVDGATYVASRLNTRQPIIVKEGSEGRTFWSLIGGKKEYANHPRLQEDLSENPPRLFGVSDASGRLIVEEVPGDFTQADLCEDDVMMLDVWDELFIWIGGGATEQERESAPKLAKEYIDADPRKRDTGTSIVTITQGNEPLLFTGFLPSWDQNFNYSRTI